MALRRHINRLQQLDQLIRMKATGTPTQLAEKLGISESAWYKIRDELVQDFSVPIQYCKVRKTYFYAEACKNLGDFLWK